MLFVKFSSFVLPMQNNVVVIQLQYIPTTVVLGINGLPPNVAVMINLFIGSPAVVSPGVEVSDVAIYPILVMARGAYCESPWIANGAQRRLKSGPGDHMQA